MSSLRILAALAVVCLSLCAVSVSAALPTTCSGTPNTMPVIDFDPATATELGTVANGTLHTVLPVNATTPLMVMHLYGDSYSMGLAYGQLLKTQLAEMLPQAYTYFEQEKHLPKWLVDDLLDLTINATKAYTPVWHFEFLQGASDGTGGTVAYLDLLRMALLPEAIKATCSIAGAWDRATATGGLLQLRALDWGTTGPFQQWPLLLTYHPTDVGAYTHTSLGWVGMYGTLTGYSSSNLAVSEKLWAAYDGVQNIMGYPWTFMLQDIMRFDGDIDAGISRIASGPRTCAFWVGLGQGERPNPRDDKETLPADFKLLGDSYQQVHVYNPENFPIYQDHDYFPDLLFVNKHRQPSSEKCMNDLFHWSYGELTAETFHQTITALEETGNMHIAVMDFDAKQLTVANASPMPNASPAYNNGFIRFNMTALWAEVAPHTMLEEAVEEAIVMMA